MEWKTLKIVQGLYKAHIIKGYLEDHDIPVTLKYEAFGKFGITLDGLGEVEILVPEELFDEAMKLIEEIEGFK